MRPRMKMPIMETLHAAHVLTQLSTGFITGVNQQKRSRGSRTWTRQVLQQPPPQADDHREDEVDGDVNEADEDPMISQTSMPLLAFHRLEFQDGSRKQATQSYHGSGRVHLHGIAFAENKRALRLDREVVATLPPASDPEMRAYVYAGQWDPSGSPWPFREGPSQWDAATKTYVLRHTQDDIGIRAYFPDMTEGTKGTHSDVQFVNRHAGLLCAYVNKYVSKASDAYADDCTPEEGMGDDVAAAVLCRYKPYEPEMVLHLFGGRFKQWALNTKSGGKRDFQVPVPDQWPYCKEVRLYMESTWRSPHTTLLDFLRKTNDDGDLCDWMFQAYAAKVVPDMYDYHMGYKLYKGHDVEKYKDYKTALLRQHRRLRQDGHSLWYHWCQSAGFDAEYTEQFEVPDVISLEKFAQEYKMNGEKVVAADMVWRTNDKYFGQWLMLNVPFHDPAQFLDEDIDAYVPDGYRYLAMAMRCDHWVAKELWASPNRSGILHDMELEGFHKKLRESTVNEIVAKHALIHEYLEGTIDLPEARQEAVAARADGRVHVTGRRIRLPIKFRYAKDIQEGWKTIEGRIKLGTSAKVGAGARFMF